MRDGNGGKLFVRLCTTRTLAMASGSAMVCEGVCVWLGRGAMACARTDFEAKTNEPRVR